MQVHSEKTGSGDSGFWDRFWFKLVSAERVVYSGEEWVFRKDRLERGRLIVSAGEQGRIVVNGVAAATAPGAVVACAAGQWVETGGPSKAEQVLYFFDYEKGSLAADSAERETRAGGETGEYRLPAAIRLGEAICRDWECAGAAGRMRAQAAFHELLALLAGKREPRDMEAPDRVKEEIDRRYREDISIDLLADLCGVSRYHLMRSFKERYGKSIMKYVTEARLLAAKRLMRERDLSIGEIADRVGFRSEPYFRTVFKKQVGIAPAVYLRNRKRKVAAYSWPILGQLLPLQIVPHAAPLDHYWTDEFSRKYGGDVAVPLGHHYEFNRSALRQAQPDCIIGLDCTISPDEAERLGEIAPVLLLPWMEADWRRHLQMVAGFLERAEDAAAWLKSYDAKARAARERVRRVVGDGTVLVLKISGHRLFVWGRKAMTVLYDDLGLAPAPLAEAAEWFAPVEPARLPDCDAGRIVVSVDGDARSQAFWASLRRSRAWSEWRPVREGAVHLRPGYGAWIYPWLENTALHQERLLDEAPRLFLCADA